jgi:hypothetical protein
MSSLGKPTTLSNPPKNHGFKFGKHGAVGSKPMALDVHLTMVINVISTVVECLHAIFVIHRTYRRAAQSSLKYVCTAVLNGNMVIPVKYRTSTVSSGVS